MRILIAEDEPALRDQLDRRAGRGWLRGRCRGGWRAGRLPRADRALRRGDAGSRAAQGRWPDAAATLARRRVDRADSGADRPRQLAREGAGHRQRRRRLRRQAVPDRGSAGAAARADPARERAGGRRSPVRPVDARSPAGQGHAERHAGPADQPRVPRARLSDASPRPRRLAGGAGGAHLRAGRRSRFEHR